jgi:hypothetical protein
MDEKQPLQEIVVVAAFELTVDAARAFCHRFSMISKEVLFNKTTPPLRKEGARGDSRQVCVHLSIASDGLT